MHISRLMKTVKPLLLLKYPNIWENSIRILKLVLNTSFDKAAIFMPFKLTYLCHKRAYPIPKTSEVSFKILNMTGTCCWPPSPSYCLCFLFPNEIVWIMCCETNLSHTVLSSTMSLFFWHSIQWSNYVTVVKLCY